LEVYGGKITPLVTDDYSGFLLTILSRNINSGLELLEAFIKSPKFDKDEVDRQKQLQLARLRKRIDDRYCYPRNLLKQALFKDYPYGQNEEGTQTSVASLDANAVQTWYQDHVRDIKPLIAILGDTQGTSLSGYFVRNFSGSRFQDVKLPQGFPEALKRKSVVEAKWDKTYSAIVFGLETLPEDDEDALPLAALLGFVFGEGGKLWENLNSQPASAYEIRMEYSSRLRGGSAIIIAFTNPGDEGKTAEEIENAVRRLSDTPISYRDYRTGLNAATGRYRLETQSGISQIQEMVCNALMQKGAGSFQNFPDDIKDVKQEDLNEAVGRIFNADHAVIVRLQGKPASSLLPSSVVHTSD